MEEKSIISLGFKIAFGLIEFSESYPKFIRIFAWIITITAYLHIFMLGMFIVFVGVLIDIFKEI